MRSRLCLNTNPATLPHEKYYDMTSYERNMNLIRSGETLPPSEEVYDFAKDVAAKAKEMKRVARDDGGGGKEGGGGMKESYLSREQIMELRRVSD